MIKYLTHDRTANKWKNWFAKGERAVSVLFFPVCRVPLGSGFLVGKWQNHLVSQQFQIWMKKEHNPYALHLATLDRPM